MKKTIIQLFIFYSPVILVAITLFVGSCKPGQITTKATVNKVEVGGEKVCASGTFSVTADTKALRDSLLAAAKNEVLQVKHLKDSATTSFFDWNLCSPISK